MNRRIRIRTYGGVRGRGRTNLSLPTLLHANPCRWRETGGTTEKGEHRHRCSPGLCLEICPSYKKYNLSNHIFEKEIPNVFVDDSVSAEVNFIHGENQLRVIVRNALQNRKFAFYGFR